MGHSSGAGLLRGLNIELESLVDLVAPSVVRVDDGSRLTATGVIWSEDGLIVSTSHGVERDENLAIEGMGGERLTAVLVGRDPDTDLALLRVNATGLTAIRVAPSEVAKIGHLVLAVARPGNSGLQATLGIITCRMNSQTGGDDEYLLYTDAVLYPGFSGGPLVDVSGQAVGIVNLMFGRGKGTALGVPVIAHTVEALLSQGRVRRAYLGIRTQPVTLTPAVRAAMGREQERALLIINVEPGSPAELAGMLMGDTLVAIDANPILDVDGLRRELRLNHAGLAVTVSIIRGGDARELTVTLGIEE